MSDKYKKKIELMVRKPDRGDEPAELLMPCPYCHLPGPECQLQCVSCQNILPFDIATGEPGLADKRAPVKCAPMLQRQQAQALQRSDLCCTAALPVKDACSSGLAVVCKVAAALSSVVQCLSCRPGGVKVMKCTLSTDIRQLVWRHHKGTEDGPH